ncbi:hypothetical protein EUX98_g8457 [Antrodiella citrinella]|uniref:Uncharacterized protein n=1 Tax=Antrodiella citrinella TaxID=2447956 RepID=A0A4S4M999_9APHY|nr:hypothetical protein EUX98_g8457 [Antrodiella citrinella]
MSNNFNNQPTAARKPLATLGNGSPTTPVLHRAPTIPEIPTPLFLETVKPLDKGADVSQYTAVGWTQEDQDQTDAETRKKVMKELVQSWMDRLQLISVITTFFAATEAQLLGITTPGPDDPSESRIEQAANAVLAGSLVTHVFAAILSFFAAFFLVRYRLNEATRAERKVEEGLKPGEVLTSEYHTVFSSNPHLLENCHTLCAPSAPFDSAVCRRRTLAPLAPLLLVHVVCSPFRGKLIPYTVRPSFHVERYRNPALVGSVVPDRHRLGRFDTSEHTQQYVAECNPHFFFSTLLFKWDTHVEYGLFLFCILLFSRVPGDIPLVFTAHVFSHYCSFFSTVNSSTKFVTTEFYAVFHAVEYSIIYTSAVFGFSQLHTRCLIYVGQQRICILRFSHIHTICIGYHHPFNVHWHVPLCVAFTSTVVVTAVVTPTVNPSTSEHTRTSSSNAGAIAGGVIGGVVGLAALILLFCKRRAPGTDGFDLAGDIAPYDYTPGAGAPAGTGGGYGQEMAQHGDSAPSFLGGGAGAAGVGAGAGLAAGAAATHRTAPSSAPSAYSQSDPAQSQYADYAAYAGYAASSQGHDSVTSPTSAGRSLFSGPPVNDHRHPSPGPSLAMTNNTNDNSTSSSSGAGAAGGPSGGLLAIPSNKEREARGPGFHVVNDVVQHQDGGRLDATPEDDEPQHTEIPPSYDSIPRERR